ncbi:GNAT family N-acetyltransferase [Streptomyces sp. NPDC048638]|uniref:GNAT family N-acetyltransferase n=1 Tax=Streptomyces sp. NPDC048638 TaxID=3365580 RepID=UPI003717AEE8
MILHQPDLAELPVLRAVERAAGEAFRPLGMDWVADDEPASVAELMRHREAGRLLAAYAEAAPGGGPVGYLVWEPVDGCLHVEQVSVHPDHARRGVGRALIDRAETEWLEAAALTLTTFAEVPWNTPYYERIGFRVLADDELTPGLREIRAEEARRGLDRRPRVCMRRAAPTR